MCCHMFGMWVLVFCRYVMPCIWYVGTPVFCRHVVPPECNHTHLRLMTFWVYVALVCCSFPLAVYSFSLVGYCQGNIRENRLWTWDGGGGMVVDQISPEKINFRISGCCVRFFSAWELKKEWVQQLICLDVHCSHSVLLLLSSCLSRVRAN